MVTFFKPTKKLKTKKLKKYYKILSEINKLESYYQKMSDEELQQMTVNFRQQLDEGKKINTILPNAFAVVREASKRVLNMRHFDVQLIGGLVLAEGNIAEMPTGEGKTLVASLSSYTRALEGKGVHIITVNDYLAQRDFDQIGKIHRFLGLTVGLNLPFMTTKEKQASYQADITYGVGTEFGFDYLRDNMALNNRDKVQRPYYYAIIDEVDSVLIDEAKTPLIVAGKTMASADLHRISALLASRFKDGIDYDFDEETKATSLTDTGIEKVEKAFGVENLYEIEHQTLYHYVIMAVRAHVIFKLDVDYIISDKKIMLIDMFTGRPMEGRTLSDGLHQAIEAKEKLEITEENKAQAQITIQNYFRMYPLLSGMTGTAKIQEKEFKDIYNMEVVQVPTNHPRARIDLPDRVFRTVEQKYKEVTKQVALHHEKGQPVIVGTTSILQSEAIADYLKAENLDFQLLNAKSVEQEVQLISLAGQLNQITVATNMAGRGTDIVLGEGVSSVGGLHVIGTEKHESRRIDEQLRGRSGRQGDPGSTQFIISLEDDMFKRFAKEDLEKFNKKITTNDSGEISNKEVHEFTERIQRIVEGSFFSMREYNLKLDDVINDQRKIVYNLRNRVLNENENISILKTMISDATDYITSESMQENNNNESAAVEELQIALKGLFGNVYVFQENADNIRSIHGPIKSATEKAFYLIDSYSENIKITAKISSVIKYHIDQIWIKHLETMSHLKEGIGLRSYQQEDPMRIYQREGLELFTISFQNLRYAIASDLLSFLQMIDKEANQ